MDHRDLIAHDRRIARIRADEAKAGREAFDRAVRRVLDTDALRDGYSYTPVNRFNVANVSVNGLRADVAADTLEAAGFTYERGFDKMTGCVTFRLTGLGLPGVHDAVRS